MLKRILNNLFGNGTAGNSPPAGQSGGVDKTLTQEGVRAVIYQLFDQHQTTTTLDVKNELRRQGFQAFQDQVSKMVSAIASQDNLGVQNNGRFNVYSLGPDTREKKHVYLQGNGEFWEALLEEKTIVIYSGPIGTDGKPEQWEYYKNLFAVRELNRLIGEKKQAGFQEVADPRPPLAIRQQYGHLFGQKPVSYRMGYFNVTKTEPEGNVWVTKNAGYTFTWHVSASATEIDRVLKASSWNNANVKFDEAQLLGEKVVRRQPVTEVVKEAKLEADNQHLFQVEIIFENGEKAILSKFQMDVQQSLLPLARQFLSNAG